MSSVEQRAREIYAQEWDKIDPDRAARIRSGDLLVTPEIRAIAAALREQPEARGVVDAEKLARLISEWELHDRTFGHDGRHPLIADFRAILTAAQQPGQEGGGEVCPRCKGAGEYEGFARHASGDPQDEYAATVQCEPCEGTGEVAAPPSAPVEGQCVASPGEEAKPPHTPALRWLADREGVATQEWQDGFNVAYSYYTQQPAQAAPEANTEFARIGDMSPTVALRVGTDSDCDVYLSVTGDPGEGVEFCTSGPGGGKSPRTREALVALMDAIRQDNIEDPPRDWWARRNIPTPPGDDAAGGKP